MPSYWWECEQCKAKREFPDVTSSNGIAHYIWDCLIPFNWDQSALVMPCKECNNGTMRITYEFPRKKERETIHVVYIVGVRLNNEIYGAMMWETYPESDPTGRWFDFKYINGRHLYGLNKPAVFSRPYLSELFKLYRTMTEEKSFP